MKKVVLLSVLLVLFRFTPASAWEGPYLGAGPVYNDPLGSGTRYLDPGAGLDLKLGYNFGFVALEADWMGTSHNDKDPGYGRADFYGVSLDARVFLSYVNDPNQFYFLVGVGSYSVDEYDPRYAAGTTLQGSGFHIGGGLEHYLYENVSLNLGLKYRIIRYDRYDVGGTSYPLVQDKNGDMLTVDAGVFFHF
jgi:opacity protein-like surface antigen